MSQELIAFLFLGVFLVQKIRLISYFFVILPLKIRIKQYNTKTIK